MLKSFVLSQFLFFLMIPVVYGLETDAQVFVNASVKLDDMTKIQARRIFSMRQTSWPDHSLITVYVMESSHQTHKVFSTQLLGLFPYQLDRIWNKLVYSGLGEEPIKVKNEQEMLDKISNTPGAIGYLLNNLQIDNANVKIVFVTEG
ncbi:MAG: hypothetical protein ABJH06_09230 [Paraglaciecola sp.]|uniref:hypothetical protein n=1 Tax=Paraglaciecola sp. TaxID=1920173 RepID=UPI003264F6B1